MIKIGQFNKLKVIKDVPFGVYLDGYDWGNILLPSKSVPTGTQINDQVDVFIYFDSSDQIIATTTRPHATLGSCALLKVVDVNRVGAFLDWGLDKDLLAPRPEQHRPMVKDKSYLVYLKQDHQGRIIASSKLNHFLSTSPAPFNPGDEVSIVIADTTILGNKVIINNSYWGLIHASDIFQTLIYGKRLTAYIKAIRDDGKIDVVLRKSGQDSMPELATNILNALQKAGGFLPLHDKSSSLEIKCAFNDSKKRFKNAIGQLYKQGKIRIAADGIWLVGKNSI